VKTRKIGLTVAALIVWSACAVPAWGTTPSGIIPPACKNIADHANLLLPCYLNDPSDINIGLSISWCFPNQTPSCVFWYQWPASAQNALVLAFVRTVDWYNNGMTTYAGPLPPDPPPLINQFAYSIGKTIEPDLDPNDAFNIYIGHLAVSLAAEIYKWVPWGLHDYDDSNGEAMTTVLDGLTTFTFPKNALIVSPIILDATPGIAINTFKFLKTNNLIGPTRIDTIGRVLDWARHNLEHFGGTFTPQYFFYNWQYWGYPPVSRVIAGTRDMDPIYPPGGSPPTHWTAGCLGTSAFLSWVLRVVNIPVQPVGVAGHTAPWFMSEDLFLSHGDDPYNALSKAVSLADPTTYAYPATDLLVSRDDYEAWFGPNNTKPIANSDQNVGRRPVDLAVQFPTSNWVLYRYCDDVANNRDHASGRVYNETFNVVNSAYTVTDLEELGLWDRLAVAKTTLGCPTSPD
jgi:hypothetical protein